MLSEFKNNILSNSLFLKNQKLLVAFSGGIDSVVMIKLLMAADYSIELAHCNFNLRGKDSDTDEAFCKDFAKKNKLVIHTKQFDTKSYMKIKKLSIQMAARELRYTWFKDLVKHHKYDFVLTAHHANDNIETLLVNLIRGTGINGLTGIPPKQNYLVRPLLFASKNDILDYAQKNKLTFRHDSSNDEVKYIRNFLRHKVIPGLKRLNPSLEHTFNNNIRLFNEAARIVSAFETEAKTNCVTQENNELRISIQKIKRQAQAGLLLHSWLSPFGFNSSQTHQLQSALTASKPGRFFLSDSHQLLIDRDFIIVMPIEPESSEFRFTIHQISDFKKSPVKLRAELLDSPEIISDKKTALLDYKKIHFPLVLRNWEKGDKFVPLGMKSHKKISDFLTGIKMPLFEKNKVRVIANSNNEIIWIIGHRIDNRYKLSPKSKTALKLTLNK